MTALKKGRIFISYRRVDSAGYAGRIYDRLTNHFGEDAVFMDVDTIEAGLDFVVVLQNAVQSCDVLIALIGRQWLNIKGETGERRLDNPEDFVRIEIAAALDRDIRVIPVLVDGTNMPRSTELPDNLLPLARRNALQVNHHSFNADASRLISQLELALKAAEDSKIMKAQALKEEQGRKQRREEIERVLQSADLAINLKDWKLAREKLNEVLELDLSHTGAQGKLDIVQSKIAEKEKALEEEAERKRKEEEEKEQARLEQEKKEREEFEARARKDAEEKTRKEDAERRRKLEAKPEPAQGKTEKQKKAPIEAAADSPPPLEVHVSEQVGDKEAVRPKIDIRPFAIGGGILLILALCIWGGISLWNNLSASTPDPTRTSQPAVEEEPQLADTKTPSPTEATLGIGSTMTGSDGMTLLYVPAGEFTMGSEDGADDEKPVHTVDLDAFWIDQTEVTNAMFADFISETGHTTDAEKAGKSWVYQDGDWNQVDGADWTHPFGPSSGISDIMNHPVIHVSWNDAQAYCS
ncbi:MAG TPA: SUMF1/EgtB/PvdO family nonheme iron enzyme, partial [Anaerolineales bacterium]|nr:SUMF1/EgtB/PvdO family nonheme iron enzyme [Anaerolineales bacterium]